MIQRSISGTVALLLVLPAAAGAQGLGGEAGETSTVEFLPLGIEHMLLGWDDLLLIVGVVLLVGQLQRAAKLISTSVAGHSFTLISAGLMDRRVSPDLVDAVIAPSVVAVAMVGLRGRPNDWLPVRAVVGGLGLIPGLGLEVGRLIAIGVIVGGVCAGASLLGDSWNRARDVVRTALGLAGLVAMVAFAIRAGTTSPSRRRPSADAPRARPPRRSRGLRAGASAADTRRRSGTPPARTSRRRTSPTCRATPTRSSAARRGGVVHRPAGRAHPVILAHAAAHPGFRDRRLGGPDGDR